MFAEHSRLFSSNFAIRRAENVGGDDEKRGIFSAPPPPPPFPFSLFFSWVIIKRMELLEKHFNFLSFFRPNPYHEAARLGSARPLRIELYFIDRCKSSRCWFPHSLFREKQIKIFFFFHCLRMIMSELIGFYNVTDVKKCLGLTICNCLSLLETRLITTMQINAV